MPHIAVVADRRTVRAVRRCGKPRVVKCAPFFSGYGASGDPRHRPLLARVDVGRDFTVGEDGLLYVPGFLSPGKGFSATALVLAARGGLFGMRLIP